MKRFLSYLTLCVLLIVSLTVISYAADSETAFSTEGGITVNATDRLLMKETLSDVPTTFEVTLKYKATTDKVNVIFGNYTDVPASRPSTFMYYVSKTGVPVLYIRDKNDTASTYTFSKVKIYTGE